jgi:hypothetical protein
MGRSVSDPERMARVLFGECGGGGNYFPVPVPYRDVTLPVKLHAVLLFCFLLLWRLCWRRRQRSTGSRVICVCWDGTVV